MVTLDDLATMNDEEQHGRRYELSPEGALTVTPLPDSRHAGVASRLLGWLAVAGWPADQILHAAGVRIAGPQGEGGRIPDLTVWSETQPSTVWLPVTDLLLIVEIVSPSSAAMDEVVKVREYARAGIPRYWMVEQDAAQTVTMHTLAGNGTYDVAAKMPLAWLLQTSPHDHLPAA